MESRHVGLPHRSLNVIAAALAAAAVAAAAVVPSAAAAAAGGHRHPGAAVVQRPKLNLRHHARPGATHASAHRHAR
jgi:hypothetical protein